MDKPRVAILVDGDNLSAAHAPRIFREAARLGRIDVARVYLDASRNAGWGATPEVRVLHAGTGKNAADLLLSLDAMEFALTSDLAVFVLVTSDRDFIHLAQRLRELGRHVVGLGEGKAPDGFRAACSEFALLTAAAPQITDFDLEIRRMIADHSQRGQGIRIADLSARMRAAHRTRISTFAERTWRAYLAARPLLYELDPRGPEARVRFLRDGFWGAAER